MSNMLVARENVLAFRKESQDTYPWPTDEFCVRFAVTEAAEALDALIREDKTFMRNNPDKAHDVLSELGDCAFMILSVRELNVFDVEFQEELNTYGIIMDTLGLLGMWENDRDDIKLALALASLETYPGFDVLKHVQKTIDKQTKKHLR